MFKKFFAFIGICVGLLVLLIVIGVSWWGSTYNSLVAKNEAVNQSWGQVQNVYQRRADLIPNLVNTVKGYAEHEERVLTEVTKARSQVVSLNVDPAKIANDPALQQQFVQAQQQLSSALSQLKITLEKYPELKANEGFLKLQDQLEGTENRIATERQNNQRAIEEYNKQTQGFMSGWVAGHYGFTKKTYFQADPGSEKAPAVKF